MFRLRSQGPRTRALGRYARPFAAVTAVLLLVATVSTGVIASTSVSLKPAADTWTNSSLPSTNYGKSATLRIDGAPVWVAYLRFNVAGVTGSIARAQLQLHANSSSKAGLSVHGVASTTWGETTTASSNAPAFGSVIGSSGALTSDKTATIDVTSLVKGNGLVSMALTANDKVAISLASRESSTPPLLVVTSLTVSPTPTVRPSATPTIASTAVPTVAPTAPPTTAPSPTNAPTPVPTAAPPAVPTIAPTTPPSSDSPVRAAFYYPWFPEGWNQSGMNPFTHYHPSQGFYNGAGATVVAGQIKAMQYGKISVGIASWWGQGSSTDVKVPMLLSTAAGTGFKWAFYYEPEGSSDPSVSQIQSDLAYINSHYGGNASTYKINGKPVVFVYAQPADGCAMASRWAQANASGADYVILKVFPGYDACSNQPNDWHQYSPAVAEDQQAGHSYAISPGFWLATGSVRLARNPSAWVQDVRNMVASGQPWQLITTFNEWGEGTAVESATEWASASGYGTYLDALHNN